MSTSVPSGSTAIWLPTVNSFWFPPRMSRAGSQVWPPFVVREQMMSPRIAAVRGGAAGAGAEVGPRLGPGRPAVVARGSDEAVRAAVRPAILLEDADDVAWVRRVDRDERLDLAVHVVRSRSADGARGERAQAGDVDRA